MRIKKFEKDQRKMMMMIWLHQEEKEGESMFRKKEKW